MAVPNVKTGRLRKAGFAREPALSDASPYATFTAPNLFPAFLPGADMYPAHEPLESAEINGTAELPAVVVPGPLTLDSLKINFHVEPVLDFTNILFGLLGVDAITDNLDGTWSHRMTRLQSELLPTYSWQVDEGNRQAGFAGCMLDQATLTLEKGLATFATTWKGLYEKDPNPGAMAWAPVKVRQPIPYWKGKVTVGGAVSTAVRKVVIDWKNMVEVEHGIRDEAGTAGRFGSRIWSNGFSVGVAYDVLFEDATEYEKLRAGTRSSFKLELTGLEDIPATAIKFKYTFDCPILTYQAMNLPIAAGPLVVQAAAVVEPNRDPVHADYRRSVIVTALDDKATVYV